MKETKDLSDTFIHKDYDHEPDIIVSEIEWAINELTDNIQIELIKAGGELIKFKNGGNPMGGLLISLLLKANDSYCYLLSR